MNNTRKSFKINEKKPLPSYKRPNLQSSNDPSEVKTHKSGNYYIKKAMDDKTETINANKDKFKSMNSVKNTPKLYNQLNTLKTGNNITSETNSNHLTNLNLMNYKNYNLCGKGTQINENKSFNEPYKSGFISKKGKAIKGDLSNYNKKK